MAATRWIGLLTIGVLLAAVLLIIAANAAEAAGVPDVERGLLTLGAHFRPTEHLSFGAINHVVDDVLNIAYAEVRRDRKVGKGWRLQLGAQLEAAQPWFDKRPQPF